MSATVVLGAQWGDEGKGKLTDILAQSVTLCCRSAGGNNAGHTIVVEGTKYDFHILPSGLINPDCRNLIGSGCVIHVPSMFKELNDLKVKGLDATGRIFVSEAAHVVFDLHQRVDGLEEHALGKSKVGTTGKGIGPCYSTKAARRGVRIGELVYDKAGADQKLRNMADNYRRQYPTTLDYDVEKEVAQCDHFRDLLKPMVLDAVEMVCTAQAKKERILIEGANALLLDIDYGTYPYVTSSNTGIGGVVTGLGGINPRNLTNIIGVVKAYTTRVGSGPFPTEQLKPDGSENEIGEKLQRIGGEFGATTGRRRRCGWLDVVALEHSRRINCYDWLNLSKLDVLDDFDTIEVAFAYHLVDQSGKRVQQLVFPSDISLLTGTSSKGRIEVEYKTFPGWKSSIVGCTKWEDLPTKAQEYVTWIEEFLGVRIKYIGTGTARSDIIVRYQGIQ